MAASSAATISSWRRRHITAALPMPGKRFGLYSPRHLMTSNCAETIGPSRSVNATLRSSARRVWIIVFNGCAGWRITPSIQIVIHTTGFGNGCQDVLREYARAASTPLPQERTSYVQKDVRRSLPADVVPHIDTPRGALPKPAAVRHMKSGWATCYLEPYGRMIAADSTLFRNPGSASFGDKSLAARSRPNSESGRLDAGAWTKAALVMLGEQGIAGVRVELLARRLNVTKGSFYWHFKDRDALLNAMLEHWRRTATLALIDRLDSALESPRDRVSALLELSMQGPKAGQAAEVELSIRLWGRSDERARITLKEVDELRMRYISQMFVHSGIPEADARARAVLAYSYIRVAPTLIPHDAKTLIDRCESILLNESAV